jgi:hypothetical protein
MIISGLDRDIEFTLHEGDYTVEQCFDLINMSESYSSQQSPILREIACKQRIAKSNSSQKQNSIQHLFYQPEYLNKIAEGLIHTYEDFRKLMVVLISQQFQLFHPDTNYFYEMPIQPDQIGVLELEMIDTIFEDNHEQFYNKIKKPMVPCAKLSMEGVEYL